jgi:hypothetical protein
VLHPSGVVSAGNGTAVSGRLYMRPLDVPLDMTFDAFWAVLTTAVGAGGTPACTVGLYPSDSEGWPDGSAGPLRTATMPMTTPANKTVTVTSLALPRGRYWTAFLYYAASAPASAPVYQCDGTSGLGLPRSAGVGPGVLRGYYVASQTSIGTLAFTTSNMTPSGSQDVPIIGLRRA